MKRDMDLIREILLWMENQDDDAFFFIHIPDFGRHEDTIGHVLMLKSAGFLYESQKGVLRMSWEGHEFLDKVRDEEIWRKTKEGANKMESWSVKLLGELATGYIKLKAAELGLPLS
ncbi:DUF2513 domain-containing protein [Erythrobacter westpacificensis]|uniref:DUF2513 domain-containing protein n=1 Tax=Erythrobacter westpacificensis TaxID=1055231 RepID=UPI0031FA361D